MSGWKTKRLGEVAETQLGKMLNKSRQKGDAKIPYLRNVNVQWGEFNLEDVKEMDIYLDERDKFTALPGDLLVCEGGEVGRCAIWEGPEPIGIQNAIHRIRTSSALSVYYLRHYLEFMASNGTLESIASGVTIKHLTQEKLRNLEIAFPPLDQQQEIVERIESALAKIDSVTEHFAQILRKGILLRRATLLDAHKSGIDGSDVRTETLRNLGTWVGGSTPSKSEGVYWNGGTVPWITSKDVKSEFLFGSAVNVSERAIGSSLLKIHPAGSIVLVARSGILEHTLPIAQAKVDFTLNQDLKACVPSEGIDPEWLLRVLQAHEKELLQTYRKAGTTVANLNFDEFLEHKVSVPSIEVQRHICDEISRRMQLIDELTAETERRVLQLEALRRSVIHQAFYETEVISQ